MAAAKSSTANIFYLGDYIPRDPDDYWSQPPPPKAEREGHKAWRGETPLHKLVFGSVQALPTPVRTAAPVLPVAEEATRIPAWLARGKMRHDEKFGRPMLDEGAMLLSDIEPALPAEVAGPARQEVPAPALDHEVLWAQLGHHVQAATERPAILSGWLTVPFAFGSLGVAFVFSLYFVGSDPYLALAEEASAVSTWLWQASLGALAS